MLNVFFYRTQNEGVDLRRRTQKSSGIPRHLFHDRIHSTQQGNCILVVRTKERSNLARRGTQTFQIVRVDCSRERAVKIRKSHEEMCTCVSKYFVTFDDNIASNTKDIRDS